MCYGWLLLMAGCSFDQDMRYYPATQGAYFLVRDTLGQMSVALARAGAIERDWEGGLGWQPGEVGGLDGRGLALWLANASRSELVQMRFDDGSPAVGGRYALGDTFRPVHVCVGAQRVLLCDTLHRQIAFWDIGRERLVVMPPGALPGRALYRSGKFYLPTGGRKLQIWQEEALAIIDSLAFDHPIADLQMAEDEMIWVLTRDSAQLYSARIDYNSNAIFEAETPRTQQKLQFSPYAHRPYGKEYTGTGQLIGGIVRPGNFRGVSDFYLDFFDGELYFIQADSLYCFHIERQERQVLGVLPAFFETAYFWRDAVGE
ncbi:MAG: hypothetical protein OHK0039_16500 [Bacteroidia bacterium]